MLKADFHIHTKEDPFDYHYIPYTAKDLIRHAAKKGFKVLSITNHHSIYFNREIESFAKKKGILLIPGAEPRIKGKDVVLINITKNDLRKIKTLDDLEKMKDSALIIAPHPFFLKGECLKGKVIEYIDSFHAIEYSHFYTNLFITPFFRFLNGNVRAKRIAKKYKKALVGTSDAHRLYEFGKTYTLVDSAKKRDDVIDAVKRNKVRLVSRPMNPYHFTRRIAGDLIKNIIPQKLRLKKGVPKDWEEFFQKI